MAEGIVGSVLADSPVEDEAFAEFAGRRRNGRIVDAHHDRREAARVRDIRRNGLQFAPEAERAVGVDTRRHALEQLNAACAVNMHHDAHLHRPACLDGNLVGVVQPGHRLELDVSAPESDGELHSLGLFGRRDRDRNSYAHLALAEVFDDKNRPVFLPFLELCAVDAEDLVGMLVSGKLDRPGYGFLDVRVLLRAERVGARQSAGQGRDELRLVRRC